MKIQIAGYGFVGMAHALALKSDIIDTVVYDPAKGYHEWHKDADAVIICVSTPECTDGQCDMSNVYDIIEKCGDVPILIKSTISLEGWRLITRANPWKSITFSPEFLRAKHALEDFKNQNVVYLGGSDPSFWINLISNRLNVIIEVGSAEELILTKYIRNSFLALKVAFFNQVYDLCEKANVEYSAVANYVTEDPRIGDSHTTITEERGFGGHCFPKDVSALLSSSHELDYDLSILSEAMQYNERLRNEKNI